ncbi:UNVERIFIED_CONTAM: hypothetical protein NCL1_25657 [Trichonephila clavipes]
MPHNHTTWTLSIFCIMKIHRLGSGSNSQPWTYKASAKPTTPPSQRSGNVLCYYDKYSHIFLPLPQT